MVEHKAVLHQKISQVKPNKITPKKKIEKVKKQKLQKKKEVVVKKIIAEITEIEEDEKIELLPEVKNVESHVLVTPQKNALIIKDNPIQASENTPQEEYVDENLAKIIELLQENLYYPRRARKRGIEGEVTVHFKLSVNAEVTEVKVLSSESDILSRGAIRTIEELSFKFPKPKENLDLSVPIYYKLQ